jgi:ketosteroid isomerase-like protein
MTTIGWSVLVVLAFVSGIAVDWTWHALAFPATSVLAGQDALQGIESLHKLDERLTLLNAPKDLQAEWTDAAVRINSDGSVCIGKAAIYADDVHAFATSPGFAVLSYKPDIRDVQVAGQWAFEWGTFAAGYRKSVHSPAKEVRGSFLRVLHREDRGEWKFARVMVSLDRE